MARRPAQSVAIPSGTVPEREPCGGPTATFAVSHRLINAANLLLIGSRRKCSVARTRFPVLLGQSEAAASEATPAGSYTMKRKEAAGTAMAGMANKA